MVIDWGYVCATSSRFEVLREGANDTLVPSPDGYSDRALSSVEVRASNCGCSCLVSPDAYRRVGTGVTVRHRLYRYPKPFHRHYREGCKSGCNCDRWLRIRTRRTGRKKGLSRRCRRNGHCRSRGECPELALGSVAAVCRSARDPVACHAETRTICPTKHSRNAAQIESSRACTSLSPTWAWNVPSSTSSASARSEPSIYSIPSWRVSPSSLAALPSAIG